MRFKEFSGRYNLAQANEELKKLDVLKSQFFANVSHEVRTPLTSIIAPVQSLYQGDVGGLQPEHHHLIGQVYRNTLKLLDMINQMLDFASFEAGQMQLRLGLVGPGRAGAGHASTLRGGDGAQGAEADLHARSAKSPPSTWTPRRWSGSSPT